MLSAADIQTLLSVLLSYVDGCHADGMLMRCTPNAAMHDLASLN